MKKKDMSEDKHATKAGFAFGAILIVGAYALGSYLEQEPQIQQDEQKMPNQLFDAVCNGDATCITHQTVMEKFKKASEILESNPEQAQDLRNTALSILATQDPNLKDAIESVQNQNCPGSNPLDRFRPNCGMN